MPRDFAAQAPSPSPITAVGDLSAETASSSSGLRSPALSPASTFTRARAASPAVLGERVRVLEEELDKKNEELNTRQAELQESRGAMQTSSLNI